MKIKYNLNGIILAWATQDETYFNGIQDSSLYQWIQIDDINIPQDFKIHTQFYTYQNGVFILNQEALNQENKQNLLQQLRQRREMECFPVINRGQLWYNNLTDWQKESLQQWYEAWLNVTQTLQPPEYLGWL